MAHEPVRRLAKPNYRWAGEREVIAMHCPTEIADTLLSILQTGVLRIRSLAWDGMAEQCGIESEHIHNLPDLIAFFSQEKLDYYWNVERPEYMKHVPRDRLEELEPLWQKLSERVHGLDLSGTIQ
jgi:hypothetical protein